VERCFVTRPFGPSRWLVVCSVFAASYFTHSSAALGQIQTEAVPGETASVSRNSKVAERGSVNYLRSGMTYSGVFLKGLIAEAYQVPFTRVSGSDAEITKMLSETYDVTVKAPRPISQQELMLMLQRLLADRLKLRVSRTPKVEQVYNLTVRKDGAKFREAVTDGEVDLDRKPGVYQFNRCAMWRFSAFLSNRVGRPVLDRTGLPGVYDFVLKPDTSPGSEPSILRDVSQLGLEMEPGEGSVTYLIVEHLEKPPE